jgi:protein TonB
MALERGQSPANPELVRLQEELALLTDRMSQQLEALRRATRRSEAEAQLEQIQELVGRARAAQEAARAVEQGERALVSPSGRIPIRVADTPDVQPPTVTRKVDPQHPIVAMQARVSGTVVLEVLVDERGNVADARVARSIPLLDQAAMDAVKQWQFRPATLKGEAVPVIVQIEMNFALR